MQENIKDKETYRFMYPTGIVSSVFLFSDRALQWLCGTTTDDGGRTAGNFTLLGDLLARMALTTEEAKGFRRPLMLSVGQAQYSRNSFPHNGISAESEYGTCWMSSQGWGS